MKRANIKKQTHRPELFGGSPRAQRGVILKSAREIGFMREAGRLVSHVLDRMGEMVSPGVTSAELNEVAEQMIADVGAIPLFKGVVNPQAKFPFPAALCTSVNSAVVHGIPDDKPLVEGDIISVDCGVRLNGYCGDSARTFSVGTVTPEIRSLLDTTKATLDLAIAEIRVGRMWSEVSSAMQKYVEDAGFSVVREFVGHGIGQEMHEEPKIPNYHDAKQAKSDFRLDKGMTMAIEPMVNIGTHHVCYSTPDRWVVVTRDGKCAAHFEHSVAVMDGGAEILTAS